MLDGLSLPILLGIFALCAGVIWVAGVKLAATTDILSSRLHLGKALGGIIVLAVATNLPELAITVSAALAGNLGVAVGNILGGIALQTLVLVAMDVAMNEKEPLTYRAASLTLVIEAVLVVAVLIVSIMATQLPGSLIAARLTPGAVAIAGLWLVGLWLSSKASKGLPWQDASGTAPDGQQEPKGHSQGKKDVRRLERALGRDVADHRSARMLRLDHDVGRGRGRRCGSVLRGGLRRGRPGVGAGRRRRGGGGGRRRLGGLRSLLDRRCRDECGADGGVEHRIWGSVSSGISRLHGGSLRLAETPGGGTTASLRLPV